LSLCEITVGKGELTVLAILYANEIQGDSRFIQQIIIRSRTPTLPPTFENNRSASV
jgi:hypothetical protein